MKHTNVPTDKQKAIFDYIVDYRSRNLCSPTIREIGEKFGIGSPNGVVCHINSLVRKGLILKVGKRKILTPSEQSPSALMREFVSLISELEINDTNEFKSRIARIIGDLNGLEKNIATMICDQRNFAIHDADQEIFSLIK